jgi:hypothetical protein
MAVDDAAAHADSEALRLAIDHSWAWFALHAGQRMQLVNYFVVAAAFITAGYATSVAANRDVVAGFIGIAGAAMSLGFARLEIRTRELVQIAEPALLQLETRLATLTNVTGLDFVAQVEHPARKRSSYGFVIRALTSFAGGLFISAAAYAFLRH